MIRSFTLGRVAAWLAGCALAGAAAAQTGAEAPLWTQDRPDSAGALLLAPIAIPPLPTAADALPLARLRLPPGFQAEVWASGLRGARSLRLGEQGTVFVGTALEDGSVYAVVDDAGTRVVKTVAEHLFMPSAIEFVKGALYVATPRELLRYDAIESHLDAPPPPVRLRQLPAGTAANPANALRYGPDHQLYLSISAGCNSCEPGPDAARIVRMNLDGSALQTVASGVRNAGGMDFDPATGELWFSSNGRNWLNENLPNDTLNHVTAPGRQDFGFPYCHQGDVPDPIFGWGHDCSTVAQPALLVGPHAGLLGLRFYSGKMFPPRYQGAIFMARHGPWNRSQKYGADVLAAWTDARGGVERMEPFLSGLVEGNAYLGRPADVLVMPDGALLVSDDLNGAIYRISATRP